MAVRLLLSVAIVANILVLVICTDKTGAVSSAKTKKNCIRIKKCPKNEEYSYCPQTLKRTQYCSERGQSTEYLKFDKEPCKEACVCKENYLRANNGSCIPEEQCDNTNCGPNEVLTKCPVDCESDYCPISDKDNAPCSRPKDCPPPACKCAFNHRRALNGSCIPTRDCPAFDCNCRPNEEYNSCPPLCPTDDCSQASPSGKCPLIGRIGIVLECNPKCRCIKGYWKLNGTCVPYGQCPGVCPTNERYSECIQAECRALNCTQKDQSIPCPRIDPKYCEKGCVCEEGYLRGENGTCVPEDQCTITCGPNEVLDNCPTDCKSDYCPTSEADDTEVCSSPTDCPPPACKCAFNHRRAANGSCIPTTDCPPFDCNCRPNEEYNPCPPLCPTDDCSQASPSGKCPFFGIIGIVLECNPRCRCIEGYWKLNGTCVPYGQCPGVCPANERYSECIQAECRALNCTQKDQSIPCPRIDPKYCEKGCVCEEGYLRGENGTCVSEDQCEINTCPTNEEYVTCIQGVCRAMNCSQKGEDVPCPDIPKEKCDSGCICKENFLRDDDGNCVPEGQCETPVCPVNEEWSTCAQAICRAQNCTQKGKPIACPMITEGSCIKACVCKENYLRDASGACVPEDQCPSELVCGENENLVNCSSSCTSDYCPKSADEEQVCVQSDPCQPACKCGFNYRRADNGTCIPTTSCPPFDCSARPNEIYVPCPPLCPSDACGQPRLTGRCPYRIGIRLICNPKCQCKDGYGRFNGTCIPFAKCPDLCPANEEYSSCVQATCRPQNCSQRDDEVACPEYDKASCQRGCVCKKNYYRNDEGVCVSYKECGGPICSPNEVYSKNSKPCPPNTCASIVARDRCADNQTEVPGCICRSGYLRLKENSICVPICKCPEMASSADCQ